MRKIASTFLFTLLLGFLVTLATPNAVLAAEAEATCKEEYLVCLNNNVYGPDGDDDEVESIECGARYAACLFHLF